MGPKPSLGPMFEDKKGYVMIPTHNYVVQRPIGPKSPNHMAKFKRPRVLRSLNGDVSVNRKFIEGL